MILQAILRIGIIRVLNEIAGRLLRAAIQHRQNSSLFPIKMIAKLEWTLRNVQENIEQLQTPTMGEIINNKSTT